MSKSNDNDLVLSIKRKHLKKIGLAFLLLFFALLIHQGIYCLFFWTTPVTSIKEGFLPTDAEIASIEDTLRDAHIIYYKGGEKEDLVYSVVNWQYDGIAPNVLSSLDRTRWDRYSKIPYSFHFWYFIQ